MNWVFSGFYRTLWLGHHGIVVGVIKDLELVELIDQYLPQGDEQDVDIPLACKNWNGNASDNKISKERTEELIESFEVREAPKFCENLP